MTVALAPSVSAVPAASMPPEARGTGRDDVRMLVASPAGLAHRHFRDLPDVLRPGDLVVVNASATLPAALPAADGLRVHVSTEAPGGYHVVEVRVAHGPASLRLHEVPPPAIELAGGGVVTLLAPYPNGGSGRLWLARLDLDRRVDAYLAAHGQPIRYGYISESWPLAAYQTVFGTVPGSAEMPSAGRPFTHEIVTALVARGVAVAPLVLHTGVSSLEPGEDPYPEWFSVPAATARQVNLARHSGGRVIAVGTTVVRALESASDASGAVRESRGWTDLVVSPGRGVRAVDGLVTGWHEPESSHLGMLQAITATEVIDSSYDAALAGGYLWHEFGDLHLLLPADAAGVRRVRAA